MYHCYMTLKRTPIQKACDIVGSQAEMSRRIGVSKGMVAQMYRGLRPVPVEHCRPIEDATNKAVMRWDLRPNDWHKIWPELKLARARLQMRL